MIRLCRWILNVILTFTIPGCLHTVVKTTNYILFHTDACHLCELAAAQLYQTEVLFIHQDICDDEALVEQYGIRIPVLKQIDTNKELNWPFDIDTLKEFLGV
ncbi:glutaredoxin family protein [Shewanella sp. D64]|uniref:glutaredoxin family protein n=1 Tax=unclassified Shewanella TaxID=196818 RepID=UPI0022BA6168|nr:MULTISPECIES: glutaredoxin family protein [unclassified Shewanella]MEC4724317.1 glutaredoxin family protein [Shewanella sp. D64]MEC4738829.1 glutaredoxin family protein [Shewanella sp. E94]WBJ97732.1 glutaredoxin family protein [Shewanella sp. MTB7]